MQLRKLFYFVAPGRRSFDDLYKLNFSDSDSQLAAFSLQGKGLQKTFWLDGREGLSLPLLSSQMDVSDDEPTTGVQTTDE